MGSMERLAATALRLISKYGRSVVFVRRPDVSDPDKPWRGSSDNETDWEKATVKAAFDTFTAEEITASLESNGPGDQIKRTDAKLYVAATDLGWGSEGPTSFQFVDDEGKRCSVSVFDVVKPGETAVVYIFRVRR